MKYWKKNLGIYNTVITPDQMRSNRNLRRFRNVRTFFIFFNPLASAVILISMLFTGMI